MISIPTTFILGAGSSMQYGFPSGAGLTRSVIDALEAPESDSCNTLKKLGYPPSEIAAFREALRFSGRASVDAFLEHRTDLMSIGKAAMACVLIPLENIGALFDADQSWYQYLYERMNCALDSFTDNAVSFITFNYDRSLEAYLHTALVHGYGVSADEAGKAVAGIRVIHVQGQLGSMPWEESSSGTRPYEPTLAPESVATAREAMRVIHEDPGDDPLLAEAAVAINAAERVLFLGFGYHRMNVERLGLDIDRKRAYLGGTAFELKDREKQAIKEELFKGRIDLGHFDWRVLQFLRERVAL